MAEQTFRLPGQSTAEAAPDLKVQTYWGAVTSKLWRDKITIFAALLGLFMIGISLAAPWIGDDILGFDPTALQFCEF